MADPERTYGRFGYEKAPKPEPPWVRRTVKCSKCGAEVDRQAAESGSEHFVGALLTGDAMRIHGDETGCWGGEAVPSDWKVIPPESSRDDATAEAAREAREHNYEIQREAYERGQEMMEEDKETQGRLVGGLLGEVLSGGVKPK